MEQGGFCTGKGLVAREGETVCIDLTLPPQARLSQYRENVKRSIRKCTLAGVEVAIDPACARLHDFYRIYRDTMDRVSASSQYYFSAEYLERFVREVSGTMLIFCTLGGRAIAAALFVASRGVIQYHLGGTDSGYLKVSPMSLLFDRASEFYSSRCHKLLHLGGGVGAAEDSLFHFKSGFSNVRSSFHTWRWIVDENAYAMTCKLAHAPIGSRFFPAYRELHNC
jgi:lipid II:glycine glycyltransferase (peptidoglycan interpeptide bridge formation enzyme)